MTVRYMGTKQTLAPLVRGVVQGLRPRRRVADLFSGMGAVASSLAPDVPVLTNDALGFTTLFARTRLLERERSSADRIVRWLLPYYTQCYNDALDLFRDHIAAEDQALSAGHVDLMEFISLAPHVGTSAEYRQYAEAAALSEERDASAYRLVALYFSSGYFSMRQAVELDSLRYAIDKVSEYGAEGDRDWLLSAWISAAATIINAPGHTAQHLKPASEQAYRRIRRCWGRGVWATFLDKVQHIQPLGDRQWRSRNLVMNMDAMELIQTCGFASSVELVYADPPYTRDQYSRFYHVYETLYLYDYPDSYGNGRYRSDRFRTPFSLASSVRDAFETLFLEIARMELPLILSYPSSGLLVKQGVQLDELLRDYFTVNETIEATLEHSTLGASKGMKTKSALERIYVCTP